MKNLRSELQEHRVNALENPRQPDPNQKGRQTPRGFATIAASTDTLKTGVAEECETSKYDESNMIFPSNGMLLLYGTAELAALTLNPNRVKTGTDLRIGLMETTQPMYFSLLKEKPDKMEVTS